MADKTIIELTEIIDVDPDSAFVPIDSGIQTFKIKAANIARQARRRIQTVASTTPITAQNGKTYLCSVGGVPITVPALPVSGDWFTIKDTLGLFATTPSSVIRAGSEKIENVAATFSCANAYGIYTFVSNGTDWHLIESKILKNVTLKTALAGGTTTLTSGSAREQLFVLSAASVVKMPTTNILDGDTFKFFTGNSGNFDLSFQSSAGTAMTVANGANIDPTMNRNGRVIMVALQNAPTTPAHWQIVELYEEYDDAATTSGAIAGILSYKFTRHNKQVTFEGVTNATNFSGTATATQYLSVSAILPRMQPPFSRSFTQIILYNNVTTQLAASFTTGAELRIYRDVAGNTWVSGNGIYLYPFYLQWKVV